MIRTITTSICIAFSSFIFSQETIHWMNAQPTSGDINEIIPIDDNSFLMRRTKRLPPSDFFTLSGLRLNGQVSSETKIAQYLDPANQHDFIISGNNQAFLLKENEKKTITDFSLQPLTKEFQPTGEATAFTTVQHDGYHAIRETRMTFNDKYILLWNVYFGDTKKSFRFALNTILIDRSTLQIVSNRFDALPTDLKDLAMLHISVTQSGEIIAIHTQNARTMSSIPGDDDAFESLDNRYFVQHIAADTSYYSTHAADENLRIRSADVFEHTNGSLFLHVIAADAKTLKPVMLVLKNSGTDFQQVGNSPLQQNNRVEKFPFMHKLQFHELKDGSFLTVVQEFIHVGEEAEFLGNIYITKSDQYAVKEWNRELSLQHETPNTVLSFGGFFSYLSAAGELTILYNDLSALNPKKGISCKTMTAIVTTANGEFTTKSLEGLEPGEAIFPAISTAYGDHKVLLYKTNGQTESFGQLQLHF